MAEHVIGLVHNEDGAYGISFPDFPGVASGGASLDEALRRGAATLVFHVAGMVEDGEALPVLRSIEELRRDREFRKDAKGAVIVAVPVELPGKALRVNISIDERLLNAIDREAEALGETRSAFLANAARARMQKVA
jgi:predicted RNase H-like HicB family nuclease